MESTKKTSGRGRPRRFDPDEAVATAQALFHARGYDAVSVAEITEALGINPPSFYAAFGSKAGLYARILQRYSGSAAIPLGDFLRDGQPVAASLAAMLEEAARNYAADPVTAGCLVVEGTHCIDPQAREAASALNCEAEAMIRAFVAARHPDEAERITDFVTTTMFGMSAKARSGHGLAQLLATARMAGAALAATLTE